MMADSTDSTLLYITYARADLARVEPVIDAMRKRGLNVAFETGAHGSGNSVHESLQALRTASTLVVFYSRAAAQSPWVEAEIRAFQDQLIGDPVRSMAIARLDTTTLPPLLADFPAIDMSTATITVAADVINREVNQPHTEPNTDSQPASVVAATRRIIDFAEVTVVAESLLRALQIRHDISAELIA